MRKSVLLIEDDEDIRDVLKEVICDEGFEIEAVPNGKEALDFLSRTAQDPPKLILLDAKMPVMSAQEFRNAQIKDEHIKEIPVVLISADVQIQKKAEDMGVTEYVQKPFSISDLLKVLKKYCRP